MSIEEREMKLWCSVYLHYTQSERSAKTAAAHASEAVNLFHEQFKPKPEEPVKPEELVDIRCLDKGLKPIEAIKEYRNITTCSLKDAKEFVDGEVDCHCTITRARRIISALKDAGGATVIMWQPDNND